MALQDYFGYQINPGTSAEALASRRRLAEQLMQAGADASPIRSPWQGAARVSAGLFGGLEGYRAEESEKARHAEAQQLMQGLFASPDAAGAPPSPAAVPAPAAPAMPAPVSPAGGALAASGAAPSPSMAPIVAGITSGESGGNPNATNPRSSAGGRGQFIDSTWLDVLKRNRPDIAAGKTDAELLAMKTGAATAPLQDEMTAALATENAAALKAAGVDPTPGKLRLAHYFGAGGAISTVKADPNTPLSKILSPQAVAANPNLAGMTAGRAQRWADAQMAQDAGASPTAAAATDLPATSDNPRRMLRQAIALSSNPETKHLGDALMLKYLTQEAKTTNDIQEYNYARGQGFKGTLQDWIMEQKTASSAEGKQPILMQGPDGKLTIGFKNAQNAVNPAKMPAGYEYSSKANTIDTPTEMIVRDQAGNIIQRIPKNISEAASQKVQGEEGGKARVAAPAAKTMVDSALSLGAQLRNHPGLSQATGAQGVFDPRNYVPGSDAYDFNLMRTEEAAKTFMAARESLKGAGSVTDFEGAKGEAAIGNLARAATKEQFLAALGRVEQMMAQSYRDLGKRANLDKVSTQGNAPIEPLANVQKWERGPDGRPRRVQ